MPSLMIRGALTDLVPGAISEAYWSVEESGRVGSEEVEKTWGLV